MRVRNFREDKIATHCPQIRAELLAKQRLHLERVRRERQSYYVKKQLAERHPERYLSLIIDGADSNTYQVPHFAYRSHASDAATKVKMHVMGASAHGRDTFIFTCPPHIAQGHNVTIQTIHEVLTRVKQEEGVVPPILNIQLDNTTKQNKGQHLIAYLG